MRESRRLIARLHPTARAPEHVPALAVSEFESVSARRRPPPPRRSNVHCFVGLRGFGVSVIWV